MALEKYRDMMVKNDAGQEFPFRIYRVTAAVGSWIAQQLVSGTVNQPNVYDKIRDHLFSVVRLLKEAGNTQMEVMVFSADMQKFTVPELQLDIDLYFYEELFTACLDFNFKDFLAKRRAEAKARREAEGTQSTLL